MARFLGQPQYKEAFALMKYRNNVDGYIEWVWNSRDGITPFTLTDGRPVAEVPQEPQTSDSATTRYPRRQVLTSELLQAELDRLASGRLSRMTHDDWHEDVFIPNYIPPVGSRIFTDNAVFDSSRDQFNLDVVLVTRDIHHYFRVQAECNPWVASPAGKRDRFA